jgi:hypothetical protein
MNNREHQILLKEKLVNGLEKVYEKLIAFKREKKSELVIMQGNKIVKIKP